MNSQLLKYITPDDEFTWSASQILKEIPGFHLIGPGWYPKQGSWMLIIGTDTPDVYELQVFYDRDPRAFFRLIADAQVFATVEEVKAKVLKYTPPIPYLKVVLMAICLVLMVPLSAFMLHRFGNWGFIALIMIAYLCGRLFARLIR